MFVQAVNGSLNFVKLAVAEVGMPISQHAVQQHEPSVLQNGLNITVGNVSALAGVRGNTALIQVTAPVQPGNSRGPLLDMGANLVGVVVSKLDTLRTLEIAGDIPQNINFAIQGAVARLFLEAGGLRVEERQTATELPVGDVGDRAREFTFQVECTP